MRMEEGQELQFYMDALEALPEAIAIFDRHDRFLFWNRCFAKIYGNGLEIRVGTRFEDHLRASVALGLVPNAVGREEEWLRERLARFESATGAHDHRLADGRWVRVQERRLAHGGRIGIRSDITDITERERSFRFLFDANPIPMMISDAETLEYKAVNEAALSFYGYSRERFLELKAPDIRPESLEGEAGDPLSPHPNEGQTATSVVTHVTSTGERRVMRFVGRCIDYNGRPSVLAAFFDMTEQHRMEDEVRRTRAFMTQIVDQIPIPVFAKDMQDDSRFVIWNRACEALFGYSRAQVVGRSGRDVFGPDVAAKLGQVDQDVLKLGSVEQKEDEVLQRPDGSERRVRTRKVALTHEPGATARFILGVSEDVTEQRVREARIAHMAHHDVLTDLPNRFLFQMKLLAALEPLEDGKLLAVLFLDLDRFKTVNDAHGHAMGDLLLKQVAERLRAALRRTDTAARFGGDEFAVLRPVVAGPGEASGLAAKLVAKLGAPYLIDGRHIEIGASIGIALAPFDGIDPLNLLERADAGLYCAKREGRQTFRFAS